VNDLRSAVTVLSMLVFVGIATWAWSRGQRERFDEAARLPFADDAAARVGHAGDEGDVR